MVFAEDSARALGLLGELLPDRVGVLGASHPDTLATRSNIASGIEALQVNRRRREERHVR